jgi:hypothetical protein
MYRDRQAHDYTLSPSSPCLGKGPDFIQPDASEAYPTTGENQPQNNLTPSRNNLERAKYSTLS